MEKRWETRKVGHDVEGSFWDVGPQPGDRMSNVTYVISGDVENKKKGRLRLEWFLALFLFSCGLCTFAESVFIYFLNHIFVNAMFTRKQIQVG